MTGFKRSVLLLLLFVGAVGMSGCGREEAAPSARLPDEAIPLDWTLSGDVRAFDRENLYDLVNGQADGFFAYGFERVTVQDYEGPAGAVLSVEVWQLPTPADAYGLFTAQSAGDPILVGQAAGGDVDPGRRLIFWQDRYYVHVRARQALDAGTLEGFAEAISAALPPGGRPPALVDRLPPDGLVSGSARFFHRDISIQDRLWLGGQNVLGLSQETDGVLAWYDLDGGRVQLVLIQYPDAQAALDGLTALTDFQIDGLLVADAHESLLGAVFGPEGAVGQAAADALLAEGLR